jgi:hypothetical protein
MENDDNQVYFKKQSTYMKGGSQSEAEAEGNILATRKTLNLTNVKFLIPSNLGEVHHEFKQMKREKKENSFELVRDFYELMRRTRTFSKFKGEMYIYERNYQPYTDKKFYELEINELEENNRLEKLKLDEENQESKSDAAGSSKSLGGGALEEIDVNTFFQLNKKKNKVVLVPSNNIFLKDENNQALTEIAHISNINLTIRLVVTIFIVVLIVVLTL